MDISTLVLENSGVKVPFISKGKNDADTLYINIGDLCTTPRGDDSCKDNAIIFRIDMGDRSFPDKYTDMLNFIQNSLKKSWGVSFNPFKYGRFLDSQVNLSTEFILQVLSDPKRLCSELSTFNRYCVVGHGHGGPVALVSGSQLAASRMLLISPWMLNNDELPVKDVIAQYRGEIFLVVPSHSPQDKMLTPQILKSLAPNANTYVQNVKWYDNRIDPELISSSFEWFLGRPFVQPDVSQRMYKDTLKVGETEIILEINPQQSGKVLISSSGCEGSLEGYEYKYSKIARHLQQDGCATVQFSPSNLVESDMHHAVFEYDHKFHAQIIEEVLKYVTRHAEYLTGRRKPEIYLSSAGAGAWASAIVASKYPGVIKGTLMVTPTEMESEEYLPSSFKELETTLFILNAEKDSVTKPMDKETYRRIFPQARVNYELVRGADHNFSGVVGGKRFSAAYDWLLCDGKRAFSDCNGIYLYGEPGWQRSPMLTS